MAADPLASELRTFLQGEIKPANFHHADHVRMDFEILRRHADFLQAANAYSTALKDMAARAGNPGAYHETIMLAFLAPIAERMAQRPCGTFEAFAADNVDLLDKNALIRWYDVEQLNDPVARATFVLPARAQRAAAD
jgi:hypothetical protein